MRSSSVIPSSPNTDTHIRVAPDSTAKLAPRPAWLKDSFAPRSLSAFGGIGEIRDSQKNHDRPVQFRDVIGMEVAYPATKLAPWHRRYLVNHDIAGNEQTVLHGRLDREADKWGRGEIGCETAYCDGIGRVEGFVLDNE
jgi:hypothetical protein